MTREIFLFKHHAENETGKLVPDRFLLLVKASGLQLDFNIFR